MSTIENNQNYGLVNNLKIVKYDLPELKGLFDAIKNEITSKSDLSQSYQSFENGTVKSGPPVELITITVKKAAYKKYLNKK